VRARAQTKTLFLSWLALLIFVATVGGATVSVAGLGLCTALAWLALDNAHDLPLLDQLEDWIYEVLRTIVFSVVIPFLTIGVFVHPNPPGRIQSMAHRRLRSFLDNGDRHRRVHLVASRTPAVVAGRRPRDGDGVHHCGDPRRPRAPAANRIRCALAFDLGRFCRHFGSLLCDLLAF
jgi:hypothetical protein